jgi:hypothetical protein
VKLDGALSAALRRRASQLARFSVVGGDANGEYFPGRPDSLAYRIEAIAFAEQTTSQCHSPIAASLFVVNNGIQFSLCCVASNPFMKSLYPVESVALYLLNHL